MTTNTRIALALAACEGMTDTELQERGPKAFSAMINRKRHYAAAARSMAVAVREYQQALLNATSKLLKAEATQTELAALDALDSTQPDTTQASAMLSALAGKKAS